MPTILKRKTPPTCRNDSAPLPRGRGDKTQKQRKQAPPHNFHMKQTISLTPRHTTRHTGRHPRRPTPRHNDTRNKRPAPQHATRNDPRTPRHTKRPTRRRQPKRPTRRHTKRHQTPPDAVQRPTTNNQHPIHQPQQNHPANRRTTPHNGKEKDPPHKHDESKQPPLPQSIQQARGDKQQAAWTQGDGPPPATFFLPSRQLSLTNQQHNAPTPDPTSETKNDKTRTTSETTRRNDKTRTTRKTPQAKRQAALQENRPRKPRPTTISITLPTRTSGATNGANNEKTIARNRAFRTIRAPYRIASFCILLSHIASLTSQTPQLINKPRAT